VNGCFWHGHGISLTIESSECCKIPKTNRDFWVAKIRRNKERDREEQRTAAEEAII
jgi:DNA mismatch endonuclease (patch repair protein)